MLQFRQSFKMRETVLFNRIVNEKETWIHHWAPESKKKEYDLEMKVWGNAKEVDSCGVRENGQDNSV